MTTENMKERIPLLDKFHTRRMELIQLQMRKIEQGNVKPERLAPTTYGIFSNLLYVTICEFSLGYEHKFLLDRLKMCVSWYEKIDNSYGERVSLEGYYEHLTLVSLSILLGLDDEYWGKIVNKLTHLQIEDALLSHLLSSGGNGYPVSNELMYPAAYENAFNAICCQNLSDVHKDLNSHIKVWYKAHKSCHWYNSHQMKGAAHFGYWSFESVAICKILSVDVSLLKPNKHLPVDILFGDSDKNSREILEKNKKVNIPYPNFSRLSFWADSNWKNESKDRWCLISADNSVELSGTLYKKVGTDIHAFIEARHEATLKNMNWYKQIGELKELPINKYKFYQIFYEGVWPGEKEPTSYYVYHVNIGEYFLAVTFTCLSSYLPSNIDMFGEILSTLELK